MNSQSYAMSEILKCLSVAIKIRSTINLITSKNEMIGILKINSRQRKKLKKYYH
jgi:hypothetical protein